MSAMRAEELPVLPELPAALPQENTPIDSAPNDSAGSDSIGRDSAGRDSAGSDSARIRAAEHKGGARLPLPSSG